MISGFKRYINIGIVFLMLCGVMAILYKRLGDAGEKVARYRDNMAVLAGENVRYRTEQGKWVASTHVLQLSNRELESVCDSLAGVVKSLGIRIRHLESLSSSSVRTSLDIKAALRDSVTVSTADTPAPEKLKAFDWADDWVAISGKLESDSIYCRIESRDTLIQAVHRIPHRFWFIRWGTKELRQEIVSSNPHSQITYTRYITIKK